MFSIVVTNAHLSAIANKVSSLAYRWADEKEYEDWNEYDAVLNQTVTTTIPSATNVVSTRRPFGVSFNADSRHFVVRVKGNKIVAESEDLESNETQQPKPVKPAAKKSAPKPKTTKKSAPTAPNNTKTLTRNEFYARYANASFTRKPDTVDNLGNVKRSDVWTHFDAKNNLEVTIFGGKSKAEPRKTTFRGIIKSYNNCTVKVYVGKNDGSGPRPEVYFKEHETK